MSAARPTRLATPHGVLELPCFLPDATRGVVKAVDAADLERVGVRAIMVNALHLGEQPGATVVKSAGGIHAFAGWPGPVFSDSGGFQVYSLIRGGSRKGAVTEHGFTYRVGDKRHELTPRKAIQRQLDLGADVLFCLDHCTHPEDNTETQRESVENTTRWARECRSVFHELLDSRGPAAGRVRPLLYAVVQGGADRELRRRSAHELAEMGFDGYGFGGWPVGRDGRLEESVSWVAEDLGGQPLHALGIGSPANVARAVAAGYGTLDCVIPSRDARHGRLYLRRGDGWSSISAKDQGLVRDHAPVDPGCDCPCCTRYTRAWLAHLFALGDHLAYRLATIHNLRVWTRVVEAAREAS